MDPISTLVDGLEEFDALSNEIGGVFSSEWIYPELFALLAHAISANHDCEKKHERVCASTSKFCVGIADFLEIFTGPKFSLTERQKRVLFLLTNPIMNSVIRNK